MLRDCEQMIPDCARRLAAAVEDLQALRVSLREAMCRSGCCWRSSRDAPLGLPF